MSDNEKSDKNKNSQSMYGFDPTGLERAAKAAKFLDNSSNSKEAFILANQEKDIKKLELEIEKKNLDIHKDLHAAEAKRKHLLHENELNKENSKIQDRLARERINYRLQKENE